MLKLRQQMNRVGIAHRFGIQAQRCVFCFSPDVVLFQSRRPHMECRACGATGPVGKGPAYDDCALSAIELWNVPVRPAEPSKFIPKDQRELIGG